MIPWPHVASSPFGARSTESIRANNIFMSSHCAIIEPFIRSLPHAGSFQHTNGPQTIGATLKSHRTDHDRSPTRHHYSTVPLDETFTCPLARSFPTGQLVANQWPLRANQAQAKLLRCTARLTLTWRHLLGVMLSSTFLASQTTWSNHGTGPLNESTNRQAIPQTGTGAYPSVSSVN